MKTAASADYNAEILRWRFSGPRLDGTHVTLCSPSYPYACDYELEAFREFILQEVAASVEEERHALLQGSENAPLWSAFALLGDLQWLQSVRIFSAPWVL